HTVTIVDGNGQTTSTVVKDGKSTEGKVERDETKGTSTITINNLDKDGKVISTTTATVKDGKDAKAEVKDNKDGTHTVTVVDGKGNTTTTIVKDGATGAKGDTGADGKNAKADVKDNKDGTHTVTITDGEGKTTTTIVKNGEDGKNAQAEVKDNGNGTHTVTIVDGNGKQTVTTIRNGKDGRDGKDADGTFGLVDETGSSQGTITKKLNNTIQIKGDAGTKVKVYDKQTGKAVEKEVQNIFVKKDGDALKVSLNPDVTVNSVTTNELKAGPVTINQDGIDAGNKTIQNVAPGVKDTDAVNVSQLRSNITNVNNRIDGVRKEARGGIAGANAAAGLPQVYIPGKSMVAASAGTFKGESAVAVGYSRSSDNGKVIFKLQGNANTQGDVGGSVGVGYQW
ncbi:MAG: YadA-like family protein, partial [Haemophilus parainfluenzae]|nr:YadA-like family protein [Haemophilus parainfluenzae]